MEKTILVPILVAVVEAIKRAGFPDKFVPLLSLGLGILASVAYAMSVGGIEWVQAVVDGIIAGLSACGLYSGAKSVIEGVRQN